MSARWSRRAMLGAALAMAGVCACSVNLGETTEFSLGGFRVSVPLDLRFLVQPQGPKVSQAVQVTNLFPGPPPPVGNRPANGRLAFNQAIRVSPLGTGPVPRIIQPVSGAFEITPYIAPMSSGNPCADGTMVGTFHVTANGGTVTVAEPYLDLPPAALAETVSGQFGLCVEVGGNMAAEVIIEDVDVEFSEQLDGDSGGGGGDDLPPTPPPTPPPSPPVGDTGTINGRVVDALSGDPVSGATVTLSGTSLTATTDASGNFQIAGAPAGTFTVLVTQDGYADNSSSVELKANQAVETSVGLVPLGGAGDGVVIVLNWGEAPSDLDLHMSGPDGSGDRFHAYFSDKEPVPHAFLDLDDQSAFGPETMTIRALDDGSYVAGEFRVWVHNYSGSPGFDASAARITVTAGGAQVAEYPVGNATGDASQRLWQVVNLTVAADGSLSNVSVVQSFTDGGSGTEL